MTRLRAHAPEELPEPALLAEAEGDPNFVTALARGLAVIRAFDAEHARLTLSEVARLTALPRATVRRCLLTLVTLEYAHTDGKHFWLAPRVLTLGYAYLSSSPLSTVAQPTLERVREQTGESCSLSVFEGGEAVIVARAAARRIMAVSPNVGSRLPAYCTALGRVLLAAQSDAALDTYVERTPLVAHTPHTVTDPARLRGEIERVREQEYAYVDQEMEIGLRSIAVPVCNARGRVVASMIVSAQVQRVTPEAMRGEVLPVLRAAAADLRQVVTA